MTFYNIGEDTLPGPVTGTAALPVDPVTAIADGEAARVPVLIGTNRDEFTLFVALQYLRFGEVYTAEQYPELLRDTFGANAVAVAERYPLSNYGGNVPSRTRRRSPTGCSRALTERMSDDLARSAPVYAYEFNDRDAPAPESMRTLPFPVGASHSLELRYLFEVGGAPAAGSRAAGVVRPDDRLLEPVHRHRVRPRPTGNRTGPRSEPTATQPWMSLQPDGSRVVTTFDEIHQCPFWASLPR